MSHYYHSRVPCHRVVSWYFCQGHLAAVHFFHSRRLTIMNLTPPNDVNSLHRHFSHSHRCAQSSVRLVWRISFVSRNLMYRGHESSWPAIDRGQDWRICRVPSERISHVHWRGWPFPWFIAMYLYMHWTFWGGLLPRERSSKRSVADPVYHKSIAARSLLLPLVRNIISW